MLDEFDRRAFPKLRVLNVEIVAVQSQEMPHRAERRPLIPLLEGVRLGDTRQQPNSQRDDIFLAISESILWTCQSAFEKAEITEEMPLLGFLDFKPVLLDHRVDWQPTRLIWQERLAVLGNAP